LPITCPVCQKHNPHLFFVRKQVPIHQNLVIASHKEAVSIPRGNLSIAICDKCGFAFNCEFDANIEHYGSHYDNGQEWSATFKEHTKSLKHYLLNEKSLRNKTILEIGCGQGEFIADLVRDANYKNKGIGLDPSYVGHSSVLNGQLQFYPVLFDADFKDVSFDVVIARHLIEHIADPMVLLAQIFECLKNAGGGRVFFETPCLEWILTNKVVWDFFHEHCSYFSASSLRTAFELTGLTVESVTHVFNNQYLWLEASVPNKACSLIDCVVDLNPNKQNRFIPGTGHPIVDFKQLTERGVRSAILMNPRYAEENQALLSATNMAVTLIA